MSALVRYTVHFRCLWLLAWLLLENSDLWTALAASRSFSIETRTESGKSSQLSSAKSKEMQQNHISITSSLIFQSFFESLILIFSLELAAWMTHFCYFFFKSSLTCRRSVCLLAHCQDVCARCQAVFVEWFVIIHRHPWGKASRHLCKFAAPSTDEFQCSENNGESEKRMKITNKVESRKGLIKTCSWPNLFIEGLLLIIFLWHKKQSFGDIFSQ